MHPPRGRAVFLALSLASLALLAVGCDDDGGSVSTTSSSTSTTGQAGGRGGTCDSQGTTEAKRAEAEGDLAFLSALSVGVADAGCLEQVVFTFESRSVAGLGYEAGYVTGPFEDPGGNVAEVEGTAFLRVVFLNGTAVDLSGEEPRETYTRTPEIPDDAAFVVDVVKVSDFEGTSEWVVGLDARHPFEVDLGATSFTLDLWAA